MSVWLSNMPPGILAGAKPFPPDTLQRFLNGLVCPRQEEVLFLADQTLRGICCSTSRGQPDLQAVLGRFFQKMFRGGSRRGNSAKYRLWTIALLKIIRKHAEPALRSPRRRSGVAALEEKARGAHPDQVVPCCENMLIHSALAIIADLIEPMPGDHYFLENRKRT